jgi:spermidine/putrescine transport system permease protein
MSKSFNTFLIICTIIVFLFIYLPIFMLIMFAFNDSSLIAFPLKGFTLNWFAKLFGDRLIFLALKNSFIISLSVTAISTIAGTLASIGIVRGEFPGKKAFNILIILPLLVPGVIIGLGLLTFYKQFNIPLSLLTVVFGHCIFTTSFVTLVVSASLYGFDKSLEEAAQDLGASVMKTFFKITLPNILPGIISGALFAFSLSFDEYIITFLNIGANITVPLQIMSMVKFGLSPKINAFSTMMYVISISVVLIAVLIIFNKNRKKIKNTY